MWTQRNYETKIQESHKLTKEKKAHIHYKRYRLETRVIFIITNIYEILMSSKNIRKSK